MCITGLKKKVDLGRNKIREYVIYNIINKINPSQLFCGES